MKSLVIGIICLTSLLTTNSFASTKSTAGSNVSVLKLSRIKTATIRKNYMILNAAKSGDLFRLQCIDNSVPRSACPPGVFELLKETQDVKGPQSFALKARKN